MTRERAAGGDGLKDRIMLLRDAADGAGGGLGGANHEDALIAGRSREVVVELNNQRILAIRGIVRDRGIIVTLRTEIIRFVAGYRSSRIVERMLAHGRPIIVRAGLCVVRSRRYRRILLDGKSIRPRRRRIVG